MPRHRNTILNRHPIDRNERHHVGRAHARMRPLMHIQIDQLRRLPHSANRRLLNRLALAYQRDHAPVVVRIHFAVQQIHSIHLHRGHNGVNLGLIASLRKIRHTFH